MKKVAIATVNTRPLPFKNIFSSFPLLHAVKQFQSTTNAIYIYIAYLLKWNMHDIDSTHSSILTWNIRCSRTVNVPINRSSCWTYADMLLMSKLTGFPFRHTVPDTSTFEMLRCDNTFNKVVFPDPLYNIDRKKYLMAARFGLKSYSSKHLFTTHHFCSHLNVPSTDIFYI